MSIVIKNSGHIEKFPTLEFIIQLYFENDDIIKTISTIPDLYNIKIVNCKSFEQLHYQPSLKNVFIMYSGNPIYTLCSDDLKCPNLENLVLDSVTILPNNNSINAIPKLKCLYLRNIDISIINNNSITDLKLIKCPTQVINLSNHARISATDCSFIKEYENKYTHFDYWLEFSESHDN